MANAMISCCVSSSPFPSHLSILKWMKFNATPISRWDRWNCTHSFVFTRFKYEHRQLIACYDFPYFFFLLFMLRIFFFLSFFLACFLLLRLFFSLVCSFKIFGHCVWCAFSRMKCLLHEKWIRFGDRMSEDKQQPTANIFILFIFASLKLTGAQRIKVTHLCS